MSPALAPARSRFASPRAQRRGLTAVELLCTVAVTLTTLGTAAGGMREFMLSQRLQGAAAQLESEVQLARSIAVLRAQTVRLAIQPLPQGSCTLIHTGPRDACECDEQGLATCRADAQVVHLTRQDARTGVRHLSTDVSLAFSATRGTVTPTATLKLVDSRGRTLHQVVNVMGRTRTCSPRGSVPGYKVC